MRKNPNDVQIGDSLQSVLGNKVEFSGDFMSKIGQFFQSIGSKITEMFNKFASGDLDSLFKNEPAAPSPVSPQISGPAP